MKKTIKSVAAVFVVLTLCLGLLSGCGGDDIVGKWNNTTNGGYMELRSDGTCDLNGIEISEGSSCTWERSGDALTITVEEAGISVPMEMTIVSLDGDTMVLELAGTQSTFVRE